MTSCFTVEGEYRIIRGCGWEENEGFLKDRTCFNRAGTKEVGWSSPFLSETRSIKALVFCRSKCITVSAVRMAAILLPPSLILAPSSPSCQPWWSLCCQPRRPCSWPIELCSWIRVQDPNRHMRWETEPFTKQKQWSGSGGWDRVSVICLKQEEVS